MNVMTPDEAVSNLVDALSNLGLGQERAQMALRLMYVFGFDHKTACETVGLTNTPATKFDNEIDTDRQRAAFADWFNAKLANGQSAYEVAYGMYIEDLGTKNLLQMDLDELKAEVNRLEKWANKLANGISEVTGIDVETIDDSDSSRWENAMQAVKYFTKQPVKDQPIAYLYTSTTSYTRLLRTRPDDSNVEPLYGATMKECFEKKIHGWYAYQREVHYLESSIENAKLKYPNVLEWIPLVTR